MDLGAMPSLNKRGASKTQVFTSEREPLTKSYPQASFGKIDESDEFALEKTHQEAAAVDNSLMDLKEIAEQMGKGDKRIGRVEQKVHSKHRNDSFSPSQESSFSFKPKFFKPGNQNSTNQTIEQVYSVKGQQNNNSASVDPY